MKYADLHLHTVFSDGTYTPAELIREAKRQGLDAVSVVDHDTVEGVIPALEAARQEGVELIPGIELTAEHNGSEVHILGYLIDQMNDELRGRLKLLRENRVSRLHNIILRLKKYFSIELDPESIFDIAKDGVVGRLHIARAMVNKGIVGSTYEAFQKYIGDRSPAYVAGFKLSPPEAVRLIRRSGGIPVLAHPYLVGDEQAVSVFLNCGIMGLEVYYPEHTAKMIKAYLAMAKRSGLLVTGGSDCHGLAKPEVRIGSVKLPYQFVEELKKAAAK